MSITDKDLCKSLLGWERIADTKKWGPICCDRLLVRPDGEHTPPPDFAHNIEWAMKLARAACKKWGLDYCVGLIPHSWKRAGTRAWFSSHEYDKHWRAEAGIDEESAAIRAAVVNVVEAHEAKENDDENID